MTPNIYSLAINDGSTDLAISAAGTTICTVIDDLQGMIDADIQCKFTYGTSGGTTVKAYIQTSLDQGATWIDLWCFTATTESKVRVRSLVRTAGEITPADGALADDTVAAGIVFGDRLRAKVIVSGTYAGSASLSIRASVR